MIPFLAAAAFACAAAVGMIAARGWCAHRSAFGDGPPPARPPVAGLILAAGAFGVGVVLRDANLWQLAVLALLCAVFAAIWFSDVRVGLIPDVFTILPLVAICSYAAFRGEWSPILSSAATFVAFGILAATSRGRGLGWGDVKLAALGAAILGFQTATLAFAAAGAAVAIEAWLRRQGKKPVAFGPYLISAISLALWLPLAA